ncbi:MAG TPA: T9SS type A sorting domain-containing protein [Ignavibacteriaceae bacterium]|nr:T9SS type A sorting domain-containing protein [Ignavibacteriaceae bacterium]
MRKFLLLVFLATFFVTNFAQKVSVGKVENPTTINNLKWANDKVIYDGEPLTRPAAIKFGDTIYVAISDTNFSIAPKSLAIFKSIDTGKTWVESASYLQGVQIPMHNMKFIKEGNNLWWFGRIGSDLYYWNITRNTLRNKPLGGAYNFDIEITSAGSWALFTDTANNTIKRYVSLDTGKTWIIPGVVSSTGTKVSLTADENKDTLFILYRDLVNSALGERAPLHFLYYKVNADGSLSPNNVGLVIPDTLQAKSEYKILSAYKNLWIFYTQGSQGNIDVKSMRSTNRGTIFHIEAAPASESVDEYWFDAVPFGNAGQVDFVCYKDSLQTGPAELETDYLSYRFFNVVDTWSAATKISQAIPFWSPRSYAPVAVELGMNIGYDVGVVYVGIDSLGATKVFWDRYNAKNPTVYVEDNNIPNVYSLSQNYPNPFNPSTTIKYSIPKAEKVKVTVFNILGKQVTDLVNEYKEAGNYQVNFNADNLSSGTYFYKIQAGSFTETKKMLLLK